MSDNLVRIPVVAGFVDFLCGANIAGNIISAEKRCNYPGRSRVTRLVCNITKLIMPKSLQSTTRYKYMDIFCLILSNFSNHLLEFPICMHFSNLGRLYNIECDSKPIVKV